MQFRISKESFTFIELILHLFLNIVSSLSLQARKEYRRVMKVKRRPSMTTGSGSTHSASLKNKNSLSGSSFNHKNSLSSNSFSQKNSLSGSSFNQKKALSGNSFSNKSLSGNSFNSKKSKDKNGHFGDHYKFGNGQV